MPSVQVENTEDNEEEEILGIGRGDSRIVLPRELIRNINMTMLRGGGGRRGVCPYHCVTLYLLTHSLFLHPLPHPLIHSFLSPLPLSPPFNPSVPLSPPFHSPNWVLPIQQLDRPSSQHIAWDGEQ